MTSIPGHPQIICYGEILWDLLPSGELPGGAPMNVAYHLNRLGETPGIITRIGIDERGGKLLNLLKEAGLSTTLVQTDDDVSTGIVHAKQDSKGDMTYDIVRPAAWDQIELSDEALEAVKNCSYFIFGSLVARNHVSRATLLALLEVAPFKVLDINLRKPWYDQALVEQLASVADLVKLNEEELGLICDWYGGSLPTLDARLAFFVRQFSPGSLIVTRGAKGAVVWHQGDWFSHPGYVVKVADTVGSGDSFLAAFLHKIISGASGGDALDLASGLGALVATRPGAWPEYETADIPDEVLCTSFQPGIS